GRVRTKTTKRASRVLIEKYYPRLTLDFHTNKRIIDEVAVVPSKRLRNKISGFTTHLMKRIQRGPVRGISFKLQEEERERKDQYVPEISALDVSNGLEVDPDTKASSPHSLICGHLIDGSPFRTCSSSSTSTSSRSPCPRPSPATSRPSVARVATAALCLVLAARRVAAHWGSWCRIPPCVYAAV
ncbi:hypothetical protein AURDEDRAFT_56602, partial [Auricularia subglabra TFB-10046 SS5]